MTTDRSLLLSGANTIEIDLAKGLLEEAGIPCVVAGPDFDVAELGRGAHDMIRGQNLFVAKAQYERAREVLDEAWGRGGEELSAIPFPAEPAARPTPTAKRAFSPLPLLLGASTVLFAYLWLRASSELVYAKRADPFVEYAFGENEVTGRWIDTGELANRVTFDEEGILFAGSYYDRSGTLLSDFIDEDRDGVADRMQSFDKEGRKIDEAFEHSGDGRYRRGTEYSLGGVVIRTFDEDGDEVFERREIFAPDGKRVLVQVDRGLEGWVTVEPPATSR